jgi:hypothetical protein
MVEILLPIVVTAYTKAMAVGWVCKSSVYGRVRFDALVACGAASNALMHEYMTYFEL